jgi:hypothetical protein
VKLFFLLTSPSSRLLPHNQARHSFSALRFGRNHARCAAEVLFSPLLSTST